MESFDRLDDYLQELKKDQLAKEKQHARTKQRPKTK
jgi:hypothetical protein